jgi:hypothetical protein
MRTLHALRWARPCDRPACIPRGRPRGAKLEGVRYERALAKTLGPGWTWGQWFEFEDRVGHGFAQADFVQKRLASTLVLEAKLSWTPEAQPQLDQYLQLAERAFGLPARGIVVCRYLRPGVDGVIVGTLAGAETITRMDRPTVWHCIDPRLVREAA